MLKTFTVLVIFNSCHILVSAQKVIFNSLDSLYELSGNVVSCKINSAGTFCKRSEGGKVFSTALYKDTLYFISGEANNLYKMALGDSTTCRLIPSFNPPVGPPFYTSAINCLTADIDGILYAADWSTAAIYKFDPYNNILTNLGAVPWSPAGDLFFYRDKLLLSTLSNGIVEVDLNEPAKSKKYMSAYSYVFYGLISLPYDCSSNKYYGLATFGINTKLVKLDLEAKKVLGVACILPFEVYDAASNVDNGNTLGVTINSINITKAACGNESKISFQVKAGSATNGNLTYTLNNLFTSTSGIFIDVDTGRHYVKIINQAGCEKDTSFFLKHGLLAKLDVSTVSPLNCMNQNGVINISSSSGYPPVQYSINGIDYQQQGEFKNLGAGSFHVFIRDSLNCTKDTVIHLSYIERTSFLSSVTSTPTRCSGKTGNISISLTPGANPADFKVFLNNGTAQSAFFFNNLQAGSYNVSILKVNECSFDTVINVGEIMDVKPTINLNKQDQKCFLNNGKLELHISGLETPYLTSINNLPYSASSTYSNLAPGNYSLKIQNKNLCKWDTNFTILSYTRQPISLNVHKNDPTCMRTNDGSIMINVTGTQSPYTFKLNNSSINYPVNALVKDLNAGEYVANIFNRDGCLTDSISASLHLIFYPECDTVFVPTAFSPDDNNINELFRPLHRPQITEVDFKLYNRYGRLVFQNSAAHNGWDGKVNGVPQNAGVYAWVMSYKGYNGEKKISKGHFLLIR